MLESESGSESGINPNPKSIILVDPNPDPKSNFRIHISAFYFRIFYHVINLIISKDREFSGKVVEVVNGDALVVKNSKGFKKIHIASIRLVDT